ncbi:MAG: recombinase family protein [Planctomycetes bacterium]|nr:recombinase family protein [Planctomycetota bacterium]
MKKSKSTTATPQPTVRVGIYTRQSVASDLEFGSIEAQREAVEAYVLSQRGEGWVALPERYDDHGYSGGDTDRPAFKRLVADIEAGKVDVLAAYKIDRVSRSLPDFTAFMATLERHGVGFVSTTQAFDTRTSMGRLTLNILASFSQFERETIAERTRDKIRATRKKGLWTGGRPILGYDIRDGALVVNAVEAETVKTIFSLFLSFGGLVATVAELQRRGIRTKCWRTKAGRMMHGGNFDKCSLRGLLTNVLYVGRLRCGDEVVDAKHAAIIDVATFDAAAQGLRERRRPFRALGKLGAVLTGILRCARCGASMTHAATKGRSKHYRSYVCSTSMKEGVAACPGSRAPAEALEEVVIGRIAAIGKDPTVLLATMQAARDARLAKQPEMIAESRRIATDRATLSGQRRNLLDALQQGGVAVPTIAARIAELDDLLGKLQMRADEITTELAGMQTATVDETAIRTALANFTSAWDHLIPRERSRVLRLLISEVRFDGKAGKLLIDFRDNGIAALAHEVGTRRTA